MIWCRSGEGCRSYACSAHSEHVVDFRVSQTQPSRITTVGALRIDIWIASRQLASHRVQSVTFRAHKTPDLIENNIAQVTGEDCPQNQKFWRKVPERRTYLRGKKEMRDGSLTGDHAKEKKTFA